MRAESRSNDVFDYRGGSVERPNRPLPSGRVSTRFAAVLGGVSWSPAWCWLLSRLVGRAWRGRRAGARVLLLRRWPEDGRFGPEVMGACRGLNLLLGMSQAPGARQGLSGWLVAGSLALFVVGVTWISRSEARRADGRRGRGNGGSERRGPGLLAAALQSRKRSFGRTSSGRSVALEGLLVLALVAVDRQPGRRPRALASRSPIGPRAVKTGVLSLVWLDVGSWPRCGALRRPWSWLRSGFRPSCAGRWLYST